MSVPRSLKSVSRHENVRRAGGRRRRGRGAERRNPPRHARRRMPGRRRRAARRAAVLPSGRSRGTRAPAAATMTGASQSSRARHGEADPQHDVADVERIAHERERAGGDERTEPVAARARDRADVMDAPEADRFARGDQGSPAIQNEEPCDDRGRAAGMRSSAAARGSRQPGPLPEQPSAEACDDGRRRSHGFRLYDAFLTAFCG